ncbi:hypothetical protein TNCV_3044551 [Trichonephila clavipes]|nr:hypothetical protein TNCV_3044551 [Trichonephila clavipes]
MYVLSRKQQNIMNEIENAKHEWAMDQKVILSTKLNKMKEKNEMVQRENDILKKEIDVWKIKENELKTKEKEFEITRLNSKLQGALRENKTLVKIKQAVLDGCFGQKWPDCVFQVPDSCSICLSTMHWPEKTQCGHAFHLRCLLRHLDVSNTCPSVEHPPT